MPDTYAGHHPILWYSGLRCSGQRGCRPAEAGQRGRQAQLDALRAKFGVGSAVAHAARSIWLAHVAKSGVLGGRFAGRAHAAGRACVL